MARWFTILLAGCGAAAPATDDAAVPLHCESSPAPAPTSCAALAPICGPHGTEACCTSPRVDGGSFVRGYDVASDGVFGEATHPASVCSFRLDRFEVSVGRFRAFVAAGMGTQQQPPPPSPGRGGWDPAWTALLVPDPPALLAGLACDAHATWDAGDALPINCVTWYEAAAFCIWDGGFLPTEAQWNFAAAGGDEQRAYPWSRPAGELAIDTAHAVYSASTAAAVVGSTSPAGDGRWGHADLAGNVAEWMLDGFQAYLDPCADCASLVQHETDVIRGGAFGTGELFVRTAMRIGSGSGRDARIGIRCARPGG